MSLKSNANADPFEAFYTSHEKDVTSQAARRSAFRRDSPGIIVYNKASDCQITRDGPLVRKSGTRVRIEESTALNFAYSLKLPVPAVHKVEPCGQGTEISMDFVDGECLEEAWTSMGMEDKQNIAHQLRRIVTAMRQAELDQPKLSAFDGPLRDCRQFSDHVGGPFNSEAEFNKDFVLDLLRGTPLLIRHALANALNSTSKIVFTHGDITPRNIIVKEGRIQAVLDWEYAGWFPEYWEYVKFFERPTDCKDWKNYAEIIFETQYPNDLVTHQALARWQKP